MIVESLPDRPLVSEEVVELKETDGVTKLVTILDYPSDRYGYLTTLMLLFCDDQKIRYLRFDFDSESWELVAATEEQSEDVKALFALMSSIDSIGSHFDRVRQYDRGGYCA